MDTRGLTVEDEWLLTYAASAAMSRWGFPTSVWIAHFVGSILTRFPGQGPSSAEAELLATPVFR